MSSADKMGIESKGTAVQRLLLAMHCYNDKHYLAVSVMCCLNSHSLSSLRLQQKRHGMDGIGPWSGNSLFRLNKCKQW